MPITPGYGETPIPEDELVSLLPGIRNALGEPVGKAAIYDLEQAVYAAVVERLVPEIVEGDLTLHMLLSDSFVRDLHRQLYGDIWTWAGTYRRHEVSIGVAPEQVAVELRSSLQTVLYRWEHTDDWTARELGVAVHAETVRIHPFTDGNGRTTRLLADLVFLAAQDDETFFTYDWNLDKPTYIALLRKYDANRDPRELAAFVPVQSID
ncbi:Fic family protein [Catellatospora methionotrophica]|uniref:Fic family protein n=1 Tax=Catellatospora methionotrophica TaxID=121620 RepID=UPI0033CE149E